jgi:hypothetical protein
MRIAGALVSGFVGSVLYVMNSGNSFLFSLALCVSVFAVVLGAFALRHRRRSRAAGDLRPWDRKFEYTFEISVDAEAAGRAVAAGLSRNSKDVTREGRRYEAMVAEKVSDPPLWPVVAEVVQREGASVVLLEIRHEALFDNGLLARTLDRIADDIRKEARGALPGRPRRSSAL